MKLLELPDNPILDIENVEWTLFQRLVPAGLLLTHTYIG